MDINTPSGLERVQMQVAINANRPLPFLTPVERICLLGAYDSSGARSVQVIGQADASPGFLGKAVVYQGKDETGPPGRLAEVPVPPQEKGEAPRSRGQNKASVAKGETTLYVPCPRGHCYHKYL